MDNQITTTPAMTGEAMETVLIGGDLSKLSPQQRVAYYQATCKSIGLNPLTKPFDYISLNGKLTLYARRDAADQLRNINGISIDKPTIEYVDDWIVVTVVAHKSDGRTDSDVGAVNRKEMSNNFGNALMKAVTKAKRRVTLSICGLGWLDETEVETIPTAKPVEVAETGEIVDATPVYDYSALPEVVRTMTSANGTLYINMDTKDLTVRYNSMVKKLEDKQTSEEYRAATFAKVSAVREILAVRNA